MATVVNIKPNDPFAGFGQAFAQSMAQKRDLENKKALMDHAEELEKKKYSVDAAMLASIPKTQEANKVAQKAEEDFRLEQSEKEVNDMIAQLITPGDALMDMGGAGIERPMSDISPTDMLGAPASEQVVQGDPRNFVEQTSGQRKQMQNVEDLKKKNQEIVTWKAELAAKGQVVTKDPTTGQLIITNAKTAAGLDVADINKIKSKQEIAANRSALDEAKQKAIENNEYRLYKTQRITDIKTMLQENASMDILFDNPEDRKNDELCERMAKEIFEKNEDFGSFMLSLKSKSEVYVPVDGDWSTLTEADYSTRPGKDSKGRPLIKIGLRLRKDELLQKSVGKNDKTYKTVGQKNKDYFIKLGIDPDKNPAFAPNSKNNIVVGNWRELLGVGEKGGTSKLESKTRAAFPISVEAGGGSGYTDPAAKTLYLSLQAGLQADTKTILDKSLAVGKASGYTDFELVEDDQAFSVLKNLYMEESKKIARFSSKTPEYREAVDVFNKKYKDGVFVRKALTALGVENLPTSTAKLFETPRADSETLVHESIKLAQTQGIDLNNLGDIRTQTFYKNLSIRYKENPNQLDYIYALLRAQNINPANQTGS